MQTRKLEQGLLSHGAICQGPQPAPLAGYGGYDVGGVCDDGDGADAGVGDDDIDDGDGNADSTNTLSC